MSKEIIYAKGLRAFNKHEKSPDFVVGTVVVSIDEFTQFIKDNEKYQTEYNGKKQLKLEVTKNRDGVLVYSINTYKKDAQPQSQAPQTQAESDGLPF